MKILLIGTGSIGKRHLANILALGYSHITIVSRSGKLPQGITGLAVFTSLEQALQADHFDTAIVCTPTANHITDILQLLRAGIQTIYTEKPISHNWDHMELVQQLAQKNAAHIYVGYDLHFDPGIQKVKEWLSAESIGRPVAIQATVGQYLPDWRPQDDYTQGTCARTATGGGVLLDLVHEFDYVYRLMGPVQTIAAVYSHTGALQIETEDIADVLLKFASGATGSIHVDYLQPQLVRNCRITGTTGSIFWDMALQQLILTSLDKKETVFSYRGFERNQRFLQIIQAFLSGKTDTRLTTLEQGLVSLQMVLAAKYSSQHRVFVQLNEHHFQ